MNLFRRGIAICVAIALGISIIVPAPLYPLAPIHSELPRADEESWKQFTSPLKLDTSSFPIWLKSAFPPDAEEEKDVIPADVPPFPFPNMETMEGVYEPQWLELYLIGSAILETCRKEGDSVSVQILHQRVKRQFKMHREECTNREFVDLLNKLRRLKIVNSRNSHDFTSDPEADVILNVPPRMLAVWAEDIDYIIKDIERAVKSNTILDLLNNYANVVQKWKQYRIEACYPVLKAVTQLGRELQIRIKDALRSVYKEEEMGLLTENILFLLEPSLADEDWLKKNAPELIGRAIYSIAAEISLLAGGLGRVEQYHGAGLKKLGADVRYIEPYYQFDKDGRPVDYNRLPVRINDLHKIEAEFDTFVQGREVFFEVWTSINENNIPVYLIKPINPYYAEKLYLYRDRNKPDETNTDKIFADEFTEFFAKASLEVIRYLELEKKRSLGESYKAPIVDANDGQIVSLSVWAQIYYRDSARLRNKDGTPAPDASLTAEIFSKMLISCTTHTYKNRVIIWQHKFKEGLEFLIKAGIPPEYWWMFLCKHLNEHGKEVYTWDFTSAGLRSADIAKAVAAIHAYEVSKFDPLVNLVGITNGDNIEYSTEYFRQYMEEKGISPLKYPFLTAEEIDETKRHAKIVLGFNPDQLVVSYSGRLVDEKAGRRSAFTDTNIEEMVKAGIQVVIYGNVQDNDKSKRIAYDLGALEKTLSEKGYKGRFIFKNSFDIHEQRRLLAASDIQVQYSTRGTGASEYTEADVSSCGGLQLCPPYWEGIINKQGIAINWDKLTGNTIVPSYDCPEAFLESIFLANDMFTERKKDFLRLQYNSIQFSRILDATFTSAAYARWWNKAIEDGAGKKLIARPPGEIAGIKPENIKLFQIQGREYKEIKPVSGAFFQVKGIDKLRVEVKIDLNVSPIDLLRKSLEELEREIKGQKNHPISRAIRSMSRRGIADIMGNGKGHNISPEIVRVRIVDESGRIVYLDSMKSEGMPDVFTAELDDSYIKGTIEVTSGLWWEKCPFTVTRGVLESSLQRIASPIMKNFRVRQIFPSNKDLSAKSKIELEGKQPVCFEVRFPCKSSYLAERIMPVAHTNIFGDWDDLISDQMLFTEHKYEQNEFVWRFAFVPEQSGSLTFYITMKDAPHFKIWYGNPGENIEIEIANPAPYAEGRDIEGKYTEMLFLLRNIFPDIHFPPLEEVRTKEIESVKQEFADLIKTKNRDDVSGLLSLTGNLVESAFASASADELKLLITLIISKKILNEWKGLSFAKIALLWNSLSDKGYAGFISVIAEMLDRMENRDSVDFNSAENMLLYFLHAFMDKDDADKVNPYKGVDYMRERSEDDPEIIQKMKDNMLQTQMAKIGRKKEFSGTIVQDIKDFGAGVNSWMKMIKNFNINMHGVQMVYLLEGLDYAEREEMLRTAPKDAVFYERIEDVEGQNIVYLTRKAEGKKEACRERKIKLVERGNCGPIIELSMALQFLNVDEMFDTATGAITEQARGIYVAFLNEMRALSLISEQDLNRYKQEVRNFSYIKLPRIERFEDMWQKEMLLPMEVSA